MDLILKNLLSPIVLAFGLGLIATRVKSDLEIPPQIYKIISIYLLLTIGLKGGVAIRDAGLVRLILPVLLTFVIGIFTPISSYSVLRKFLKLDVTNSAAIAAHYGSISAVTFVASWSYASITGDTPEGFLPGLMAIMEVPGIITALLLAQRFGSEKAPIGHIIKEIVSSSSMILLLGGMIIGYISDPKAWSEISNFFVGGFKGALVIFLLELGMVAAKRLRDLKKVGIPLVFFGIGIAILHGSLGAALAVLIGMSPSGAAVFGAITGSASYIAAPAAVRLALPEANPTFYLTASLGITFPFNLTLGIPLYRLVADFIHSHL